MDAASLLLLGCAAWWAGVCLFRLGAFAGAFIQPLVRRKQARRHDLPPVSIVIPVSRREHGMETAFASVYAQNYPQFEVLVSAAQQNSPVIELARQVAASHTAVPTRPLTGNVQFTHNPKVSNLAPAIAAARYDLILVKDSNIELERTQLRDLVRNFTPDIGLVCAVPIAIEPQNFAADVERAMLNGHAAPLLLAASAVAIPIGFGKVMLFDRHAFERAGGIAIMANTFGDDHALAKALGRIGLRTVFSEGLVRQRLGVRSMREVWDRQLRWMLIRRVEAPFVFVMEPFIAMAVVAAAGAAASAVTGLPWWSLPLATVAAWLAVESAVALGKGWGWTWRYPLAVLGREILIPALWLAAWTARSVSWAGIRHDVKARV